MQDQQSSLKIWEVILKFKKLLQLWNYDFSSTLPVKCRHRFEAVEIKKYFSNQYNICGKFFKFE